MPSEAPLPGPNGEYWVRLTTVAEWLDMPAQAVRDAHAAMGRPHERVLSSRGRAVEVNSPKWLQCWAWYYAAHLKRGKRDAN